MRYLLVLGSILSFSSSSALAGEELKGRAEVNFRYGQERSITMMEFWVPFMQDGDSVLYGDLRMMGDNQDNREGNLGVGYRQITEFAGMKGVAGVHSWIDRRDYRAWLDFLPSDNWRGMAGRERRYSGQWLYSAVFCA